MATAVLISSQFRKKERQQRHWTGFPAMYLNCAILAFGDPATLPGLTALYIAMRPDRSLHENMTQQ
jgi:hypothetical protein